MQYKQESQNLLFVLREKTTFKIFILAKRVLPFFSFGINIANKFEINIYKQNIINIYKHTLRTLFETPAPPPSPSSFSL